jgi:uncharacterized protein (TIGR02996 family)
VNRQLLDAILDAPGDDAPRLMYADWLRENGDDTRADFIETQIALAREKERRSFRCIDSILEFHGRRTMASVIYPLGVNGPRVGERIDIQLEKPEPGARFKYTGLLVSHLFQNRIRASHGLNQTDLHLVMDSKSLPWSKDDMKVRECGLLRNWSDWVPDRSKNQHDIIFQNLNLSNPHVFPNWCGVFFRRGFVDSIDVGMSEFFYPDVIQLFADHPITRVNVINRSPAHNNGVRWYFDPLINPVAMAIPECLIGHFSGVEIGDNEYGRWVQVANRDTALKALSDACISYGRQEARKLSCSALAKTR